MKSLSEFYDCRYYKLNTADYQVPQKRQRIIFIGFRRDLEINFTLPEVFFDHIPMKMVLQSRDVLCVKKSFLSQKRIDNFNRMRANGIRYSKLCDLERPCFTLTSRLDSNLIKYSETEIRSLTLLEAKRIQTFPDTYSFTGFKTHIDKQIGNAVPCRFAFHLGSILRSFL